MTSPYYAALRAKLGRDLILVPAVAAIIHDHGGDLLVVQREDGRLSLPAGAIEPGETPQQALVREVREETGLNAVVGALLGVFGGERYRTRYASGDEVEFVTAVYSARIVSGSLTASVEGVARYVPVTANMPWETEFPIDILLTDRG